MFYYDYLMIVLVYNISCLSSVSIKIAKDQGQVKNIYIWGIKLPERH